MLSKENYKGRHYTLDTIQVGETASFEVKITEEMQQSFLAVTGDCNPMHTDSEHAKKYGYDNVLVYGMLTASFYSTLAGMYLPGQLCLFQECDIKWNKPVYIGDRLKIYGIVKEIDRRFQRITVKAYIENEKKEKVSRAKLICGVLPEEINEV